MQWSFIIAFTHGTGQKSPNAEMKASPKHILFVFIMGYHSDWARLVSVTVLARWPRFDCIYNWSNDHLFVFSAQLHGEETVSVPRFRYAARCPSGWRHSGRTVAAQTPVGRPGHAKAGRGWGESGPEAARQGGSRYDAARTTSNERARMGEVRHATCRATLDEVLAPCQRCRAGVVQVVSQGATSSRPLDRDQWREPTDDRLKDWRSARTQQTQYR